MANAESSDTAAARPRFVFPTSRGQQLRFGFWRRVTAIGERLGSDFLTYNPGTFEFFHAAAVHDAPVLVDALLAEFPHVRRVADIGCGSGAMLAEFKRRGCDVQGCEYAARGRRYATRQGIPVQKLLLTNDGTTPLAGAPYDLAISCEVAEHVPAALADELVRYIAQASNTIVFTAAHPGQGGTGHVNEQPKTYWIEKFQTLRFAHDPVTSERIAAALRSGNANPWLSGNLMAFRRSSHAAD